MLRADTLLSGFLTALSLFFIASQVFRVLNHLLSGALSGFSGVRPHFIYMLSAVLLLIPFQIFLRQERYNSIRGVVLATICAVFGILYFFRESIFSL